MEKRVPVRMTAAQIRQAFLDFFAARGHTIVPSSSLVPVGDPTLLFTNAGMNQFKNVFLGLETRPYKRAASVQKCMRVSGKHNDLENVGPSPRHHTFFEMLGNFSFGDYFKREAIHYAFECLTQVYGLDPGRLVFTVHQDDDEAYRVWVEEIGVPPERVFRMGDKTNFWMMGDTGPCGPTSEIHYDWGPEHCTCGDPRCSVALDNGCDRWLELWNLVFMQFDQKADGTRTPLPRPGVDTGMGLERLAVVLQGVFSNYETDLFLPIIERAREVRGHTRQEVEAHRVAYRVIADHTRAAAFLIADGVLPGNVGRGYVLRMIIRRAARFGRKIGFQEPFLARVAEAVIEIMGGHYRELVDRQEHIFRTLTQEEERFLRTLDLGLSRLEEVLEALQARGDRVIPGEEAFRLYDSYGLPLEITRDVARERGFAVDEAGFQRALAQQRERARAVERFELDTEQLTRYRRVLALLQDRGLVGDQGVEYDPYSGTERETTVAALLVNGEMVQVAKPGDRVEVVLPATCFYVESGGQVSDIGHIARYPEGGGDPLWEIEVEDTRQPVPGLIVHVGRVKAGHPRVGDPAWAVVDFERRWDIMRNHTATHLLHAELRALLGSHVVQAGSLVAPDRLRFDFTHGALLSQDELDAIVNDINAAILADYPVHVSYEPYQQAIASGAMALFGEKYGEIVRVVRIGWPDEPPISAELCGGTHVYNTSQIGAFVVTYEGGVGSGVRRLEAVTGREAVRLIQDRMRRLSHAATYLEVRPEEVDRKVLDLLDRIQSLEKELARLRREVARQEFEALMRQAERVGEVTVLAAQSRIGDLEQLREMTDWFRERVRTGGVIVLATVIGGRPNFVAAVTPDLAERGLDAVRVVRAVAQVVGGSGGGRPTLAQAGGRETNKIGEALQQAPRLVSEWLRRNPS
ncbi:alanine--tRNA ligase [Thermoflexus sp.]|uniref:alanine--tRNA ligase n=1 Tax=Thermoflexus sp. TaxID=1969742 RepID=UPI00332C974B